MLLRLATTPPLEARASVDTAQVIGRTAWVISLTHSPLITYRTGPSVHTGTYSIGTGIVTRAVVFISVAQRNLAVGTGET